MEESDIRVEIAEYLEDHLSSWRMGAYELKLVKLKRDKSFPFSRVALHQYDGLIEIKHKGKYIPLPNTSFFDRRLQKKKGHKKPCDFFIIKIPSWIIICFYEERKKKLLYFIDIDKFIEYKNKSLKKSINEQECNKICDKVFDLMKANRGPTFPESIREIKFIDEPIVEPQS